MSLTLRPWERWGFGIALVLLLFCHLTVTRVDFEAPSLAWLNSTTHTAASIWIRLGSIPLRVMALVWLVRSLSTLQAPENLPPSLSGVLLQIWTLLCGYYTLDLALTTPGLSPVLAFGIPALALVSMLAALLFPSRIAVPACAMFLGLTLLIYMAQASSGENNAFTLFGIQGIALIAACWRPAWAPRLMVGMVLIPAFGYLFPLAEKLLLNPLGWLSGRTFQGFAQIYGYTIPLTLCVSASWLLLGFQASFAGVLTDIRRASYLYPLAIVFHLAAGLILGFGTVLNPWIPALLLSWAALQMLQNNPQT